MSHLNPSTRLVSSIAECHDVIILKTVNRNNSRLLKVWPIRTHLSLQMSFPWRCLLKIYLQATSWLQQPSLSAANSMLRIKHTISLSNCQLSLKDFSACLPSPCTYGAAVTLCITGNEVPRQMKSSGWIFCRRPWTLFLSSIQADDIHTLMIQPPKLVWDSVHKRHLLALNVRNYITHKAVVQPARLLRVLVVAIPTLYESNHFVRSPRTDSFGSTVTFFSNSNKSWPLTVLLKDKNW